MGMILGYTLSLSITTLILFVNILKENYCDIKKITIKDIRKEAYKYREFLYCVLDCIIKHIIVFTSIFNVIVFFQL